MHVHIAGVTADPKWSKATLLPLLIANGITTVRDMGGDLAALQSWRKEIAEGKLVGPRIYCSRTDARWRQIAAAGFARDRHA